MEFGQRLKNARIQSGLTQEDVVRQVGVSRQTVSNWENNRSYPDLASVLKLSDLYGLSLDALLKEDHDLRQKLEERAQRIRRVCSYLHDIAMLLIAANAVLAWLGKSGTGIVLGLAGFLLICAAQTVFVRKLGLDWKMAVLRCATVALWLTGFLIRIHSGHENKIGDLLWMAGLALQCYGGYCMKWDALYPKHMTAFTGFALALVLVFGAAPLAGNTFLQGKHIEENPFIGQTYRVSRVLQGGGEPLPMVYLGSTNRAYLDEAGEEQQLLGEPFVFIIQPEGAARRGVWEMIPEETPEMLYRVAVEADGSVTMACMDSGAVQWEYELELAPRAGCSIRDVLGVAYGSAVWRYAGSIDEEDLTGGLPLRGRGTVYLTIPGQEPIVTIYEELRIGDQTEQQTLNLNRDKDGRVEFYREARKTDEKQTGIYRIPYEDGEFLLVLNMIP